MKFCSGIRCSHYSAVTRYPRKCYYEPQCWRGYLDLVIAIFGLRLKHENDKSIEATGSNSKREVGL